MSSPSLNFSNTVNLFEILICYSFLISSSFSFLRLNLSPSKFSASLLTVKLSLTFAPIRQWSVSQSAPLKDGKSSIRECHLLSVNMWPIGLWVFPSGQLQVYVWIFRCGNIMILTTRFFDVVMFTILSPSSLLSWCTLSLPIVGLNVFSFFAFFHWSLLKEWSIYLRKLTKTCRNSS